MTRLQALAAEMSGKFEQKTRTDDTKFWALKDGQDAAYGEYTSAYRMCRDAHGDMGPDDYRYQFIVDSLDALAEESDPDDISLEADIYTGELTAWLGSRNDRYEYCDQAVENFGQPVPYNTLTVIGIGQVAEKEEVLSSVRSFLETMITDAGLEPSDELPEGAESWDTPESDEKEFSESDLTRCKKCGCWIYPKYGEAPPSVHAGQHTGERDDPKAPGDHDDICDDCGYAAD